MVVPNDYPEATVAALKHAVKLSFVSGFRWVMLVSASLALLSAVSAAIFIKGRKSGMQG